MDLYALLEANIAYTEDSPLPDPRDNKAVVIRFVPEDINNEPFPVGTSGFAGLVGLANWLCVPDRVGDNSRRCQLWADDDTSDTGASIVLANIRVQADPDMTVGYLAHELSHVLGAVDGVRCPAHLLYNPAIEREPDCQDAYWWFGVTGFFDLKPSGIVWDALHGGCAQCDRPEICAVPADILLDLRA